MESFAEGVISALVLGALYLVFLGLRAVFGGNSSKVEDQLRNIKNKVSYDCRNQIVYLTKMDEEDKDLIIMMFEKSTSVKDFEELISLMYSETKNKHDNS